MNGRKVILGEFESELCAEIAKRDLRMAGINAKILKNKNSEFLQSYDREEIVMLMVSDTQIEFAKSILKTKFI